MVSTAPLQVLCSSGMPGLRGGGSGMTVPRVGQQGLGSGVWRRKSHLGKKCLSTYIFWFMCSTIEKNIYMKVFCSENIPFIGKEATTFLNLSFIFYHSQIYLACFRHIPFPNK